jgi:hypothetical protein
VLPIPNYIVLRNLHSSRGWSPWIWVQFFWGKQIQLKLFRRYSPLQDLIAYNTSDGLGGNELCSKNRPQNYLCLPFLVESIPPREIILLIISWSESPSGNWILSRVSSKSLPSADSIFVLVYQYPMRGSGFCLPESHTSLIIKKKTLLVQPRQTQRRNDCSFLNELDNRH